MTRETGFMSSEALTLFQILEAWGCHPRIRISRQNVGKALIKGRWVRFGVPGTADIVGLIAPTGRLVMLEVKSKTGKQRAAQLAMQRVITAMGGLYAVCRTLAEADAVLIPLVGPRE